MAEHCSATPHEGNTNDAVKATTALDPTEELTKGINKLSTTDDDAVSEDLPSDDDERSWSSGEVTVVDEPSTVENRRKDAIDRIMKSFCSTLETKLSISAKPVQEPKEEQPRPLDNAKKEQFSPPPGVPKLSSFRSKSAPGQVTNELSSPAPPKLSSFRSKPATTEAKKEDTSTPAPLPKLSSFNPKPAQTAVSKEESSSPPAAPSKLSSFRSKPTQQESKNEVSSPAATLPKLSSFKPKPVVAAQQAPAELPLPGGLGPFMIPPTVSFPALEPPSAPAAASASPAAQEPEQLTKTKEDKSVLDSTISRSETTATARSPPTQTPVSKASSDDVPVPEAHSSSNVSEEDKHKSLLEDVLLNGGSLDALENIPGLAAMAQEFKAAAEAHTSGGAMWDTMGKKIGALFGLGDASSTPPPSADEPSAFHASFVSRTSMMPAPAPPVTKAPPVTPPQNHYMRSFPGSQFSGGFGNHEFKGFLPVGGSSQQGRSAPPYAYRSPEGPVQALRSPQPVVTRKRDFSEDSESELEDRDESPRPVLMPKRKSASYQAKSEPREVVDEPDGDGRRKKARKAISEASTGLGGGGKQKFACPYFKRNPRKYRNWTSCPGPGWEEVHRVKTHLYRRHALPLQCPRCWDTFKTDTVLQAHLQMDPPCTIKQNTVPHEGFTKDQEKRLRSRKKAHADMTDEDKWVEIYQILFPDDDPDSIPGPYYDTFDDDEGTTPASGSGSGDLEDYSSFVRREMPTLVRRELEALFKTEVGDVEERLRPRIEQIVLDLQPRLMSLYKQSQIPLSEYGPAQQLPDYGVVPMNMSTPTSTPGLSTGSCAAGLTPSSVISPGSVPSPAPVGMLTPESTTSYAGDSVPFYGGFMGANIASMMPNAGIGGAHQLYNTDAALLGTGGGGYDFDANEIVSGGLELNWDDEFSRILDPGVFMPPSGDFAAPVGPVGAYAYRG